MVKKTALPSSKGIEENIPERLDGSVDEAQVVDADGRASEVVKKLRSPGSVSLEEPDQRPRAPVGVAGRVKEGTFPPTPLRDPHHLAPLSKDLARALTREAHQRPMLAGHGAAFVHRAPLGAQRFQRTKPPGPDPSCRCSDILVPQGVRPGDPGLEPKMIARLEKDRTPSPAPSDHFYPGLGNLLRIENVETLGAPENQRRMVHLSNDGLSSGLRSKGGHIEQRRGTRVCRRVPVQEIRSGPAVPGRPGRWRQEAAARYGSHSGSTSER